MQQTHRIWTFFMISLFLFIVLNLIFVRREFVKDLKRPGPYNASTESNMEQKTTSRHRRSLKTSDIPSTSDPFHPLFECNSLPDSVIGGKEAEPHSQPWMAYIAVQMPARKRRVCAGTVISDRWILSAAHCFRSKRDRASMAWVTLGAHNLIEGKKERQLMFRIDHSQIFVHENFDGFFLYNDIALLCLPLRIPSQHTFIRPACLPLDMIDPPIGTTVTASGWGVISLVPIMVADVLQTIEIRTVGCDGIKDDHVCALKRPSVAKDQDTCLGDSGGPLIWQDGPTSKVIGSLSFGSLPCNGSPSEIPAYYSRTIHWLGWINDTIQRETALAGIKGEHAMGYC